MARDVTVPRLGWAMEKGTFLSWKKQEGDAVRVGEILFEMEGDKAVQEVESLDGGTLHIPAPGPEPGEEVVVGQVIALLLEPGEATPPRAAATPVKPTPAPAASVAPPPPRPAARAARAPGRDRAAVSPRARRVARELGISLDGLRGTGTSGRVTESDVRAAVGSVSVPGPAAPGATALSSVTVEMSGAELKDLAERTAGFAGDVGAPHVHSALLARLAATSVGSLPDAQAGRPVSLALARLGEGRTDFVVVGRAGSLGVLDLARDLASSAPSNTPVPEIPGEVSLVVVDMSQLEVDGYTPAGGARVPLLVAGRFRSDSKVLLTLHFQEASLPLARASRLLARIRESLESPSLWLAR